MIQAKQYLPSKRYQQVLLGVAVFLLVAVLILSLPGVQKKILLSQAEKYSDDFAVDYVHLLPWSLKVDGLRVSVPAADVSIDTLRSTYCPTKLLWRVVHLDRLQASGARIALKASEDDTPAVKFPGIFTMLNTGYGFTIEELTLDSTVSLPNGELLEIDIPRGELQSGGSGDTEFHVVFDAPEQKFIADVSGIFSASQNDEREIDELKLTFGLELEREVSTGAKSEGAANTHDRETLSMTVATLFTPWLESVAVEDQAAPRDVLKGDKVDLQVNFPASMDGITLNAGLEFDAANYLVTGDYSLQVASAWLEQVIANKSAPLISESGDGAFEFKINPANLSLTYTGDTRFTTLERLLNENPALPDSLALNKTVLLSSDLETATVSTFNTSLRSDRETALLSLGLREALEISLNDPLKLLESERTIAEFDLLDIPVEWLDGVVPEGNLTDGKVSGRFILETKSGKLNFSPVDPLSVSATTITTKDLPAQVVSLSARPWFSISGEMLTASIAELELMVGEQSAASLDVAMNLPLETADSPMSLKLQSALLLDNLKSLSILAPYVEQYPSPDGLDLSLDASIKVHPSALSIDAISIRLGRKETSLVEMRGLQTFGLSFEDLSAPDYKIGGLAEVTLNNLDLSWANPYLDDINVKGSLREASFQLESIKDGGFELRPQRAVKIQRLDVTKDRDRLLENIFVSVEPSLSLTAERLGLAYARLRVSGGSKNILSGQGEISLPRESESANAKPISIAGNKRLNLNELSALPFASALISYEFGKNTWVSDLRYDLDYSVEEILARNFSATISTNKQARLSAVSKGVTRIRPKIGPNEALAQHVIGGFGLKLVGINSQEISDLVPLGGIHFESVDGEMSLESDGEKLTGDFNTPLQVRGISIRNEAQALINPFDVSVSGGLRTTGEALDADVDELSIKFQSRPDSPALSGDLKFHLEPDQARPLQALAANFAGNVPVLLNQPVILPEHSLSNGHYEISAQLDPAGDITGAASFGELVAREPLAVREFSASIEGKMAADGRGFEFSMPITGQGKTGETDGRLHATFKAPRKEKALLDLNFESDRFYLNDLLASVAAISAPKPKKKPKEQQGSKEQAPHVVEPPSEEADRRAFWDILPADARLSYSINQLYYTDYVIFNTVSGLIDITAAKLNLQSLNAFFHDSPLSFNGAMTFLAKTPSPYDVKLLGEIRDFNLNQFFSELVPGVKPRAEGLFGVSIDAFGQSPNLQQFRNNLFFDLRLQSREGLFRPLPPDSGLLIGASDVLGIVGEGLSYMPTGGFGAGALSRLVNYIKEIDYDIIDLHVTRGDSRDIVIEQALVQSPTVRLTAAGGIDYEYGKDVLDSPLTLDAQMNMSGKGAAILYSMDLLENVQDDYGYYAGPKFAIRGNANEPSSNFAEIITAGAKGTVAGGVTRPISGLIGNIKHRWLGDETKAADTELKLSEPAQEVPREEPNNETNTTNE